MLNNEYHPQSLVADSTAKESKREMSLYVFVSYEPDGSPSVSIKDRKLQLKVSRLQSGRDVCKQVYEQAKDELKGPIDDYTLYWPERKVWIHHDKQLGLVKLEPGSQLQFRPRKTYLKIRFLDASSKCLLIDETRPVRDLVADLCSQLRLEHPEELSLVVAGDYAVQKHHPAKKSLTRVGSGSPIHNRRSTLTRKSDSKSTSAIKTSMGAKESPPPLSPGLRRRKVSSDGNKKKHSVTWTGTKVKKQISKKHQIRLDTPWLDPGKSLAEQEVTENDELILMYRFYYHMELERGSPNIEMLYKQARATYLAGELLCSASDTVQLSAILCQMTKGDYSKYKYSPEFLSSIKTLIAPPKCKLKGIAKQITVAHRSLEGLSTTDAMCWFVKLWSSLDLFGVEFLSCTNLDTKDKGLIGVSKNRIMFLLHKKKKSFIWDIDSLMHWDHDAKKDTVALTLTHDGATQVLNLHLQDYSGVLVDCLRGHKELSDAVPDISRMYNEFQFSEELELAISEFAPQAMRDVKDRKILSDLTYEKVFWAGKIENPMLSEEELSELEKESWENPVFDNMDQLMDERFNFLDFSEYTGDKDDDDINDDLQPSEEPTSNGLPLPLVDSSSLESSPTHSPSGSKKHLSRPQVQFIAGQGKGKGQSPLLQSHRTSSETHLASRTQDLHIIEGQGMDRTMSYSHSGYLSLTNGLLTKDFNLQRGHSRSKSGGFSAAGESESGLSRSGGPLSSSSLPPDSLRRLVAEMGERKGPEGPLTVSYHEAAQ